MQKTDSYQRDLIANVSHDLKTPLTMIKSYAEMINDIREIIQRSAILQLLSQRQIGSTSSYLICSPGLSRLQSNSADKRTNSIS